MHIKHFKANKSLSSSQAETQMCFFIWVGVIHVVPLYIIYRIGDTGLNSSPMRSSNQVHPIRFDNIQTLGPLPVEFPRFLSAKLVMNSYVSCEISNR